MANYGNHINEPGQYPTTAWTEMELPEQDFGSGAAGTPQPSDTIDQGTTNTAGQYPHHDYFTGVPYSIGGMSGSGAPGSTGISSPDDGGSDQVTFSKNAAFKGEREPTGMQDGMPAYTVGVQVSGKGDWTQANSQGYQADARLQMPGVAGNTPAPGDTNRYQTDPQPARSSGHVMYGGFLNGQRPPTPRHPSFSGPGT